MLKLFTNATVNASFRCFLQAKGYANQLPTDKQIGWLEAVQSEYKVALRKFPSTRMEASKLIEKISIAIKRNKVQARDNKKVSSNKVSSKSLTRFVDYYVVLASDKDLLVKIKRFQAVNKEEATKAIKEKYEGYIELITDDLDKAKHTAKMFRDAYAEVNTVEEESEVITQEEELIPTVSVSNAYELMKDMSIDDCLMLCKELNINTGRARTKKGVMKKVKQLLIA